MTSLSRLTLLAIFCGLTTACVESDDDGNEEEDEAPVDSDGDGLFDDEEAELGTDPENSDSDGDGFEDLVEVEEGTNPTYEYSHSYTGGYNVGYCADGMAEATGPSSSNGHTPLYAEGDVMENFTLTDQHGEDVDLYSFCGQHVMHPGRVRECTGHRNSHRGCGWKSAGSGRSGGLGRTSRYGQCRGSCGRRLHRLALS
jgi:hypothetical protein